MFLRVTQKLCNNSQEFSSNYQIAYTEHRKGIRLHALLSSSIRIGVTFIKNKKNLSFKKNSGGIICGDINKINRTMRKVKIEDSHLALLIVSTKAHLAHLQNRTNQPSSLSFEWEPDSVSREDLIQRL